MLLIYMLIGVFLVLFGYKIFLAICPNKVIEGLETQNNKNKENVDYQPYNVSEPNNSLILAQQNAGNIEVLKGRIDELDGVKEKIDTIQQNIDTMQIQIDGLVNQQAEYAQDLVGNTPVEVTGTEELTVEDVEEDNEL